MHDDPSPNLGDVIADFEREATPDREVQAALSHVEVELGTMPVSRVRARHVIALLDDLHEAGISPRRENAVVDALGSLFAFARARGLTTVDPVPVRATVPAAARATPATNAPAAHSTTLTVLALGTRVASWAAMAIVLVFVLLLLIAVLALA